MKKQMLLLVAAVATAMMLLPVAAQAHVTLQPNTVPADSYKRVDVRVPNESDTASTTKVEVKFPAGVYSTSYEPTPGWKVTVKTRKLDEPVEAGHSTADSETDTVTFTATGDGIAPGQFMDFGLSIRTPAQSAEPLEFPSIQTYSDGEIVRWIEAADADKPAPTLTVTAAEDGHHGAGDAGEDAEDDDSTTSTTTWIALGLGAFGVLLGLVAVVSGRRRV